MSDWENYHNQTKEALPRELLVKALGYVRSKDSALDLGAGALTDSKYLVSQGFERVTAVDIEPSVADRVEDEQIEVEIGAFADVTFPEDAYDIINAQYSLPFTEPGRFQATWDKILCSLKAEGIIVGQFFGDKDEWNTGSRMMTFVTREEAEELLSNLKMIVFREEERDGKPVVGDVKHWHIFHFIAQKLEQSKG